MSYCFVSIPTFGICARIVFSCFGGKNVGATGEGSAGRHTQCNLCIGSNQFLLVTSSVIMTYPFTADDNHLQKSTFLSWVLWYAVSMCSAEMISSQVWSIFIRNFDREIIWKFCVIMLLYQASVYNTFCINWRAILCWLSKCYSILKNVQSWHVTSDPLAW